MKLMVRTRRVDYHSDGWHLHRAISFAWWYGLAGYVALRQVAGVVRHTWPLHSALIVLACLVVLLAPPVEGHHWLTYRRFRWFLAPLNVVLYVVGVMPVSPAVNWAEMRLRHLFHFRNQWPGTLIALPTVGLLPLWVALGVAQLFRR